VHYLALGSPARTGQFPNYLAPDGLTESGWWHAGFEEWDQCLVRARKVAAGLRAMGADDARIAMITHGAFASALIMALVGTPPDAGVHFSHHNTGITHVRFRPDGGLRLRYLNRVPHLAPGLIT
jgi:2,3-bisphosphoglycerate-dependent phosphoglycerate mutase/probable phosphoglycerate mutase